MKLIAAVTCLAALACAACGPKPDAASEGARSAAAAEDPSGAKRGSLEWAIAGDWRIPEEKARDAARHPAETLKFFEIKPSDTVVEIWPGGGWYTAILGPYLKQGGGKLIAAEIDPGSGAEAKQDVETYTAAFIGKPQTFGEIQLSVAGKDSPGVAPDGVADAVLTFNANPKDKADYPLGVWMLPPNMRAPAPGAPEAKTYDPATYKAIGESDRMTLKFRKPAP